MKTISIGKIRGFQHCATPGGKFAILALDHRNNMRRLLHPENEGATTAEEITVFKRQVVAALGNTPSAYLLDPLYGSFQNISSLTLPGERGLLVALEETGYMGAATERSSQCLPKWSAEKAKRLGASGVKLLVYYHPESKTRSQIENLVMEVAKECQNTDIPFFLEILTYSLDPAQSRLAGKERQEAIIESARALTPLGADVLKAEFPGDTGESSDLAGWEKACRQLTEASPIPWILLSASAEFELFLRQMTAACLAGASGVAAGRAIWKEACELSVDDRATFLATTAKDRMRKANDLVSALAQPWTNYFRLPEVNEDSYIHY